MVVSLNLHCLGHRMKYGNLEVGNTTQQFLSITRPCYSIEFIESFLFWVTLLTYNIGIYICIYIYKVSYIHSFFFVFNCNGFSAMNAKRFEIWKNNLWNWRVDCFIARTIKWCWVFIVNPFSVLCSIFFLAKIVFPLVSFSLAYRWVNQPRFF